MRLRGFMRVLQGGGGNSGTIYFLLKNILSKLPPPTLPRPAHTGQYRARHDKSVVLVIPAPYLTKVLLEAPPPHRRSLRTLPAPHDIEGDPWSLRTTKQVAELLGVDPACLSCSDVC